LGFVKQVVLCSNGVVHNKNFLEEHRAQKRRDAQLTALEAVGALQQIRELTPGP